MPKNKPKQLSVETKPANYVNWLTYSYMEEPGLGQFLASVSGCKEMEVELLDSPNDTSYTTSVDIDDLKSSGFDEKEISQKLRSGGIEYYYMHQIFCWLLKNEHIKPGNYVISMSW